MLHREEVTKIISLMGISGNTIKSICRMKSIDKDSVWEMITSDTSLMDAYNNAKKLQLGIIADEMLDIIDYPLVNDSSTEISNRKLQIETRKWILSKLMANVYGEGSKEMEQDIQIDI